MMDCNSPWLVNLVATTRDDKNIYMLLEAVMGGELFAYLQVGCAESPSICKPKGTAHSILRQQLCCGGVAFPVAGP